MNGKNVIASEKGMSLVGVLMAAALLGVIATWMAQMINMALQGQRSIDTRVAVTDSTVATYALLESAVTCAYNFGDRVAAGSNDLGRTFTFNDFPRNLTKLTKDNAGTNTEVFRVNDTYQNNKLRLTQIGVRRLEPIGSLPTSRMSSTIDITYEAIGRVSGPPSFRRSINMKFVLDQPYTGSNNPNVQSCFSVGGVANQIWSKNSDSSVFYQGNIGIGTNEADSALVVNGASRNYESVGNSSNTIDFSTSNIQYTTRNCGTFNLQNLKDGGTYSFIVQGTTANTCVFNAFSDTGSNRLTVHYPSGHGATQAGEHTIYTAIVAGSHVYFAWVREFD